MNDLTKTLRTLTLAALAVTTGCSQILNPHRGDETVSCPAGANLVVACDDSGTGSCSGDPVLSVCDGTTSVTTCRTGSGVIASDDDSGSGVCPRATLICPPSGSITVVTRPFGSGNYTCAWAVEVVSSTGSVPPPPDGG